VLCSTASGEMSVGAASGACSGASIQRETGTANEYQIIHSFSQKMKEYLFCPLVLGVCLLLLCRVSSSVQKMRLLLVATSALVVLCSAQDSYSRMAFPNKPGLALFDQAKLGLFVHWGPVSQWGTEISFPLTCGSFPCDVRGPNNTARVLHNAEELAAHRAEYAALARTWNPVLFNATDLAELAYTAGFRYLTHVAEHCDGFSQWNATQNRAYSVMTSPFGRDIVGEMMAAFRARGLRAGVYFCPSTWNSNLYWWPNASTALGTCCSPNYDPLAGDAEGARWEAYLSYLHGQVTELTEGYAPDHFWFDSGMCACLRATAPASQPSTPYACKDHLLSLPELFAAFQVSPQQGLQPEEVEARIKTHGANILPSPPQTPECLKWARNLLEPLLLLLMLAALLSFVSFGLGMDVNSAILAGVLVLVVLLGATLSVSAPSCAPHALLACAPMLHSSLLPT
jgi:hypothetical protein